MNSLAQQLEQLDLEDAEHKKMQIERDNCVKLMHSQPFQDVIEDGYFTTEAARLCMAKSSDLDEVQMKNIDNMIMGVGGLANYLNAVMQRGRQADQRLEENGKTREEIHDEMDRENQLANSTQGQSN